MSQQKGANPQERQIPKAVEATQPTKWKMGHNKKFKVVLCSERSREDRGGSWLRDGLCPLSSCGSFTQFGLGPGPDIRMIPRIQILSCQLVKGPVVG